MSCFRSDVRRAANALHLVQRKVMTHVVDALSSGKGPDLDRTALIMVDVATKVGSDEAVRELRGAADWLYVFLRDFALLCCSSHVKSSSAQKYFVRVGGCSYIWLRAKPSGPC